MQSLPATIALSLSALFGLVAVANALAPSFLIAAYDRWEFPRGAHRTAAIFAALAAAFLFMPITRLWGVAIAAMIVFVTDVLFISRERYAYAVPGLLIIAALVPASLAGPF